MGEFVQMEKFETSFNSVNFRAYVELITGANGGVNTQVDHKFRHYLNLYTINKGGA